MSNYERQPSLERKFNVIAPVSAMANYRLQAWGLSPRHIEALARTVGNFSGDYEHCEEKAREITAFNVYSSSNDPEYFTVPVGFVGLGREHGMECSGLAVSLAMEIHLNGLMSDINAETDSSLGTFVVSGNYKDFFSQSAHTWLGFVNFDTQEMIVLDPSFQQISYGNEYGYEHIKSLLPFPINEDVESLPPFPVDEQVPFRPFRVDGQVPLPVSSEFQVTTFMQKISADTAQRTLSQTPAVPLIYPLGLSKNHTMFMSAGVATMSDSRYFAYLRLTAENATQAYVLPSDNNTIDIFADKGFSLTWNTRREVRRVMQALGKNQIHTNGEYDIRMAPVWVGWDGQSMPRSKIKNAQDFWEPPRLIFG